MATQTIPGLQTPSNELAAFFAKLENAVQAAYPECAKCGAVLQRGQLVDTTGNEHIVCPSAEPHMEMLRRLR